MLVIAAANETRMVIDSRGYVGIGNTAPQAILHVSGNSMMTGAITANSTLNVMGAIMASNAITAGSSLNVVAEYRDWEKIGRAHV